MSPRAGEGAPFVPVYHRALVAHAGRSRENVVVVNIGGVANITRIGADGSLTAGDTGPGNALIDDFVRERTGAPMDKGGALAEQGHVDRDILERLLANPWFSRPFPKSLDRNAFSLAPVSHLSTEDGAATLAAFTADSIALGIDAARRRRHHHRCRRRRPQPDAPGHARRSHDRSGDHDGRIWAGRPISSRPRPSPISRPGASKDCR